LDDPDLQISTSLDGDRTTHQANRTNSDESTSLFERNLDFVLSRYGAGKVSALPTINPSSPPDPDVLIDSYVRRGFTSIFLRPINYQGFARKRHADSREQGEDWRAYHETFVRKLIERNWSDRDLCVEETYLSLCLNRIFRSGLDRHVDLRNPNPVGVDYVVIDYDGRAYPTDEARMLSRAGVVDLSIGDVAAGWDTEVRATLNAHATNTFDEDCSSCAFQPYCGRDIVDDIARYGRIDVPRTSTAFCKRHLHLFDFIFELIYSDEPSVQYSLRKWLHLPSAGSAIGARL
jgi:radical SAM protein with 4Fe4S-binding SPASM domain